MSVIIDIIRFPVGSQRKASISLVIVDDKMLAVDIISIGNNDILPAIAINICNTQACGNMTGRRSFK